MGLPTRVAIILGKALLDRLLSPERTNELVEEFKRAYEDWRRNGSLPEPQGEPDDPEITIRKAHEELRETGELTVSLSKDDLTNATEFLHQVEEKLDRLPIESVSDPAQIQAVIDEELPGSKNTYIIWLGTVEI